MDCEQVGKLIRKLRTEKGLTQQALADRLSISDRTVSKWERGGGCPDVSLLGALSKALEVDMEQLLLGRLQPNELDGGNMKNIKFYACPDCGNLLCGTGDAQISCCGRPLAPLVARDADEAHAPRIEEVENDYFVTLPHEMRKQHFVAFVAYVSWDRVLLVRLYPEQGAEARFPRMGKGALYTYCSQHGLWKTKL